MTGVDLFVVVVTDGNTVPAATAGSGAPFILTELKRQHHNQSRNREEDKNKY